MERGQRDLADLGAVGRQHFVRSRRRRASAGSVMFITATTLGLLALVGLYGISVATQEAKVAGFVRQSTQTHVMSKQAIGAGAAYMAPQVGCSTLQDYGMGNITGVGFGGNAETLNCISGTNYAAADKLTKACIRKRVTSNVSGVIGAPSYGAAPSDVETDAFGGLRGGVGTGSPAISQESLIEFTFPHTIAVPGNASMVYLRTTVTTIGMVTSGDISKQEIGRGHITVGPCPKPK